jgi:thiol-disulfide isomerase/thioredoxin
MQSKFSPLSFRLLLPVLLILFMFNAQSQAETGNWVKHLNLEQYENKVIYIDFWASWCRPCRKSFPWINAMQEKYKDKGLVVIGINLDADLEKAYRFLKQTPAHFKLYSDPRGVLADQFTLIGMPSSLVIGVNGEVRHRHVGFKKSIISEYEKSIVQLLNEIPPAPHQK